MPARKILLRSLMTATAVTLFSLFLGLVLEGVRVPPIGNIIRSLSYWYTWACAMPFLARFFERFPLSDHPWRYAAYYACAGVVAGLPPTAVDHVVWLACRPAPNLQRPFLVIWLGSFMIFWIPAGVFQTIVARRRVRELQGLLVQAELQNLKSQLHPHFLFNTLHTISVLIRQDAEAANRVLLKLSELLRISLDQTRTDQIPLQQELDFLEAYLSIERTRFEERLTTRIDADGVSRAALVPTFLLQPLVENAVRHGIAPRAAGGSLNITARRIGDALALTVEDNGAGLAADYLERRARGCGLRNTESRLRAIFGEAASLKVEARPAGGVSVHITVPYRQA